MKDIKVERFIDTMCISDEINAFLEENNVEYVDMRCSDNSVFLIYRDLNSDDDNCDKTYREIIDEYLGLI